MSNEQTKKCSKTVQRRLQKSITSKSPQLSCVSKNGGSFSGWKTKAFGLKDDLHCLCQKHPLEYYPALKKILPENYDYRVCSFSQMGEGFKATLRMPSMSSDKAQEWKTCFENTSFTIFRVCRTFPGSGRYNVFKMDYACQHNTSRGSGKCATKKTGCKAELSVTVKRVVKKSRSRDKHLPEYPTYVFMRWCHNHSLDVTQSLRYRDVGEDTMKELMTLYHRDYTPGSAYRSFKSKLMNTWGNKFDTVSKDRCILPEKQYVYRLFAKMKKKEAQQGMLSMTSLDPTFDALHGKLLVDVILPAAGSSTRMKSRTPKPFISVLGSHIIAYTIDCFHRIPWVRHIVVVVSLDRIQFTRSLIQSYGFSKVIICEGSHARHRSIYCGLQALKNECVDSSVVIIHDGARPFVSEDIIENVAVSAGKHGAAGVVRPLVSTVIKADGEGLLETALKRSDFRNSEMPQGFRYGIISGAYEKCSDEDFDHGTECLLLASKYSKCAAVLLEGNDHLWKVTYQKDIPLMEMTVKLKYTRLSLIQKSSMSLKCMEPFQSSLIAKGLSINSSEEEGANTIVCFLDVPSNSTTASVDGAMCAKQCQEMYNKLPNTVSKLNLMMIAVFVEVEVSQPEVQAVNESQNEPLTMETASSLCSSGADIGNPNSSSQLFPSLQLPPHQHQQSAQNMLQSQHLQPLPSKTEYQHPQHQHHHFHNDLQQQQQHQHEDRVLAGNLHDQVTPLSNSSCPPSSQPLPFAVDGLYEYPRHKDSFPQTPFPFDAANSQPHVNDQISLSYPLSTPSLNLSPTLPVSLPNQSHMDCLSVSSLAIPDSNLATCVLFPHQPADCCQDILSFSNVQPSQNAYNESHSHTIKGNRQTEQGVETPYSKALQSKGLKRSEFLNNRGSCGGNETKKPSQTDNSKLGEMDLMMCRLFLESMEGKLKKADMSRCLVGVLCKGESDVSDALVDLIWGRNQFLNGQVLSFC